VPTDKHPSSWESIGSEMGDAAIPRKLMQPKPMILTGLCARLRRIPAKVLYIRGRRSYVAYTERHMPVVVDL
jgi:hypothetical protein